jgi:hypothetical protein
MDSATGGGTGLGGANRSSGRVKPYARHAAGDTTPSEGLSGSTLWARTGSGAMGAESARLNAPTTACFSGSEVISTSSLG